MANVLVCGGAGFIGSHTVDKLISFGHDVLVLDNLSTGKKENINKKAKFVLGDILDEENLSNYFNEFKPDYVIHLAGQINLRHSIEYPKNDAQINILGSLNVLNACVQNNVKKIIFSSTGGAIYSESATLPWTESSLTNPSSPYGLAKLTVEKYLQLYKNLYDLNFVSLRYSNVFGPRQNFKGECGVISIFLNKIREGQNLTIFGDGTQVRDYVYVSDVAMANVMSLNDEFSGNLNVSTGKATSVNKIVKSLQDLISYELPVSFTNPIKGELMHSILDNSKIKELGWEIRVPFFKGLRRTVKYELGENNANIIQDS